MRSKQLLNAAAFAIGLAGFAGLATPRAFAGGGTQYDKRDIVATSQEYFKLYADAEKVKAEGLRPMLSDADLADLAQVLAEDVKNQQPVIYNDILAQLLSDYRNFPAHRSAIETLLRELRASVSNELAEDSRSNVLGMVMHQIFNALTVVWVFECGRGFYTARSAGLQGLELFTTAVRTGSSAVAPGTRASLVAVGIGTGAGLTQAVYEHLRTKKLDPVDQLKGLQASMVRAHAERLVSIRTTLQKGIKPSSQVIDAVVDELAEIETDLLQLNRSAPELKVEIRTAAADLLACRKTLLQWGLERDLGDIATAPL